MSLSYSFVRVCVLGCKETDVCKEKQREALIACTGKVAITEIQITFQPKSALLRNEEAFLSSYFQRTRTSCSPCN